MLLWFYSSCIDNTTGLAEFIWTKITSLWSRLAHHKVRVPEAYGGGILKSEEGGLGVAWGSKRSDWGWQEVEGLK